MEREELIRQLPSLRKALDAVDLMAARQKARLVEKAEQGFDGWDGPTCADGDLENRLIDALAKHRFVDVVNFAMMLDHRERAEGEGARVERDDSRMFHGERESDSPPYHRDPTDPPYDEPYPFYGAREFLFGQKYRQFRSRALLDACHEIPCQFRIPGWCTGGDVPSVPCHSNRLQDGKGRGVKADDCHVAAGCPGCHAWLDEGPADKVDKGHRFDEAHARTLRAWLHRGDLVVGGGSW